MDLKELENGVNPDEHWYYQTKKICLFSFFKKNIVDRQQKVTLIDIGAGSGFFSLELYKTYSAYIEKVFLVDLYYTQTEISETKNSTIQKVHSIPAGVDNAFLILMDVIEHIEDDQKFIEEILLKVSSRNFFFITVPAFQYLWSGHDVYLGHYRRYTLSQLKHLLGRRRIHVENIYYQYALIFPIVWVIRNLESRTTEPKNNLKPANFIVNSILKKTLHLEILIARYNKLFGLTCTAEGYIE